MFTIKLLFNAKTNHVNTNSINISLTLKNQIYPSTFRR